MKSFKRLQWVTTFLLLSVFSYVSIVRITGNELDKAYAKVITSNADVFSGKHFVATIPSANDTKEKVFGRLIDRFTNLANQQQELCNISEEHHDLLVNEFGASIKTVEVNGDLSSVIQLDLSKLNAIDGNELRSLLGIENVHCRLVDAYNNIILILTAHLS